MARGSIRKHVAKDGAVSWYVRVDVVDPATGKRRQPQRHYRSRREAEDGLRAWLGEIERGVHARPSKQSVRHYLEWWLTDCAAGRLKPTTLASYQWMCAQYALPEIGAVPLARLDAQRLISLYAAMQRRGLAARTCAYLHTILHSALREAVRLGQLASNPADLATPPRQARREAAAWTPQEAARFLSVAAGDSYWPLWLLALHTGLRRSELLGLRWRDVDVDAGALQVRQSVVRVANRVVVQQGAKRGGKRLSLDGVCVAALRAHRKAQAEARLQLGPLWTDHELVFPNHKGEPAHPVTVAAHFDRLQREAGVPRLPFHGLRHTHATILMLSGVHPKVVSERLGHADIGITLRVYSHVLPQMEAQAAEVFAAALAQAEQA